MLCFFGICIFLTLYNRQNSRFNISFFLIASYDSSQFRNTYYKYILYICIWMYIYYFIYIYIYIYIYEIISVIIKRIVPSRLSPWQLMHLSTWYTDIFIMLKDCPSPGRKLQVPSKAALHRLLPTIIQRSVLLLRRPYI